MSKPLNILMLAIVLLVLLSPNTETKAAELVTNGGFETGTLAGWSAAPTGSGWYPWQVTVAGAGDTIGGIALSSPLFGTRSAWGGFCCNTVNNPEFIQQDVTLPAAQTASFQWSERIQSNLYTFCSVADCGTNTWRVQILNTSNVQLLSLQTVVSAFSPTSTTLNTGWRTFKVRISQFAGQTIRIRFSGTYASSIAGLLNGPGRMEIDGVSVQSPADPTAANISVSGRVVTADGSGIRNVVVSLVDAGGNTRRTRTGSFGYYRFDDIEAGQNVILSVASKRYTFANPTRVIAVTDSVEDADFIADN